MCSQRLLVVLPVSPQSCGYSEPEALYRHTTACLPPTHQPHNALHRATPGLEWQVQSQSDLCTLVPTALLRNAALLTEQAFILCLRQPDPEKRWESPPAEWQSQDPTLA